MVQVGVTHGDTMARHTKFWESEVELRDQVIANLQREVQMYNQIVQHLKAGAFGMDRIVVMDDKSIRVLPAPPEAPVVPVVEEPAEQPAGPERWMPENSCNSEMTASMTELAESKNEKKEESVGAASNG